MENERQSASVHAETTARADVPAADGSRDAAWTLRMKDGEVRVTWSGFRQRPVLIDDLADAVNELRRLAG